MAQTPQEWLPILAKRMDERAPLIAKRRRYADGNADLPEMSQNVRASWEAFQKKSRTNYGGLAAESLANRVQVQTVTVGDGSDVAATEVARRVWRDNRMVVQVADATWDAIVTGVGYLTLGVDEGGAVLSREDPGQFIAAPDPVRPWRARAALKVWRDDDEGTDYALVWVPGARQVFTRPSSVNGLVLRGAQGSWVPGEVVAYAGQVPVAILEGRDPRGVIEPHYDVLDRINLGKLQRLVTTAMQAFRQRALKMPEGMAGLKAEDESGNQIDPEEMFSPSPGAIWDLPDGIDIWESQGTDIRPLLEGEKEDARTYAAVTQTPVSVFVPDGANQTAEGASQATDGQKAKAKDYIARFKPALASLMVRALAVEGVDVGAQTVEVLFESPEHVSMTEKYAAAAQAKAAGVSLKAIQRNILSMSPEQIAQDAADRAEEQLAAATLVAAVTPRQPAVSGDAVA